MQTVQRKRERRTTSMGELRLAGVSPGCEPVRADIRGGVVNLPDEDCASLVVKVVVVFIGVSVESTVGIAVGIENGFEPTVGAERSEEHTSELQSPYVISYAVF